MAQTKLTPKREAFCTHYLLCWNQTQAAIDAGFAISSAHAEGSRLMRDVKVQARLRELMAGFVMSPEEVLARFTEIARGDIRDIVDESGNLDMKRAIELQKTHLIKTIKSKSIITADEDGEGSDIFDTKVDIYDKQRALENLAKYHNLINRIVVEDWRSQALADIKAGRIQYQALADMFDTELALQLFHEAGIPVEVGED